MPLLTIADLKNQPIEVVREHIELAEGLGDMYLSFIENDDEDEQFQVGWHSGKGRAVGIHASEISRCQRQVVYTLLGTKREGKIAAFWKKKFRAGHLYHEMLQRDFKRMCAKDGHMTYDQEVRISPDFQDVAKELGIHSSCDGLFTYFDKPEFQAPRLRVVNELKSASPDEWKALKEPKEDHIEQTTIYQACLDVPLAIIGYYNKGTGAMTPTKWPWLRPFDARLWETLKARMIARHADAAENKLPDRLEGLGCDFCPYGWLCQPGYLKKQGAIKGARQARDRSRNAIRYIRTPLKR